MIIIFFITETKGQDKSLTIDTKDIKDTIKEPQNITNYTSAYIS